jgi:hypothetical protein
MITSQQIAWAAGIFEGEGCCSWTSRQHNCQEVMVKQNDRWILDRFSEVFGGKVSACNSQNTLSKNQSYRWRLFGANARGFLMTVYGFLSPHRQEQVKAIGVFDTKEN